MTLTPGSRLGPYEVLAPLGAGGMGEVWRARDTKLGREVALKVLPQALAQDAERLGRFEREAQLLAALNHPHIAAIYGVEDSTATKALVLELVEGETLGERVAKGPLALAEALAIAGQIADALEAAHEKGIVHRDLKPANVKLTENDAVKVLDFGLAKALDPAGAAPAPTTSPTLMNSPTLTAAGTQLGVILGTAAYMAPEQARGLQVDKRADIWAFGALLYEMLSGRRLFAGETVSDTLAAVLRADPDWSALPPATPANVRRLLARCLERDRKLRLRDIADARLELADSGSQPGPVLVSAASWSWRPAIVAAALGLGLGSAGTWLLLERPAPAPAAITSFSVQPATDGEVDGYPAISPDGRHMVYTLFDRQAGVPQLWLHDFATGQAKLMPGTEGALEPFWSPDGRFIAFFARGELRKMDWTGGVPQTLTPAADPRGGTWGAGGDILLTVNAAAGLFRLPAAGGRLEPASQLQRGEQSHRYPWFLPDGKHYLFVVNGNAENSGLYWGTLGSAERKRLLPEPARGVYDRRGYLLYISQNTLVARAFDPSTGELSGEATPIASGAGSDAQRTGRNYFGVSNDGTVAYRTGTKLAFELVWFDRTGKRLSVVGTRGGYSEPAISPDGRQIAVQDTAVDQGGDLWIYDAGALDRRTRLTFGEQAETAVWSPDSAAVSYSRRGPNGWELMVKPADGAAEHKVWDPKASAWIDSWRREGNTLLFELFTDTAGADLWLLSLDSGKAESYLATPNNETHSAFAPDGHLVSYTSDESGTAQIYVQTVPASGSKWQISTAGGDNSIWRSDGKEIYYIGPDRALMAVPVLRSAPFASGPPERLFQLSIPTPSLTGNRIYASPSADGSRFLVNSLLGQESETIQVILNWAPPPSAKSAPQ